MIHIRVSINLSNSLNFPSRMEEKEKIATKLKLAACIRKIMQGNKEINIKNDGDLHNLVDGIRQLEASSRLSYTIVQGVSVGERDPQFTTLIAMIEDGLEMTLSDFAKIYDSINEEDIRDAKKEIAESRKSFLKKKTSNAKQKLKEKKRLK